MRTKARKEKGVAIVAVSAALALLTVVVFEFRYDTNVDYASAQNAADDMRAYFIANSVMNLAKLTIKVQHDLLDPHRRQLASLGMPDMQIGDFISMLETPFCGGKAELADMAKLAGIDADGMKGLGLDFGSCHVEKFESDDGKINMNCANGSAQTVTALGTSLQGLVAAPVFDPLFQEHDAFGDTTDRNTFVKALIDYVDRDEAGFGVNGGAEDYGYERLKEPYRAKNNYIDSVDELKLVRGMDDRKWSVFGPVFTVYGRCKVNVAATQNPITLMGIIYNAAKDPKDPVINDLNKLYALAVRVSMARSYGMPFDDTNAFVDFVKDPDAALGLKGANGQRSGGQVPSSPFGSFMPGGGGVPGSLAPVDGVVLDPAKVAQIAVAQARRTYRVVAAAQVGRVEKRIIGVWDTETHNQNMRPPADPTDTSGQKGTWVYWREE